MRHRRSNPPRIRTRLRHLSEESVDKNPLNQFNRWYQAALDAQIHEPSAMVLATASSNGGPSARIVLLKGVSDSGFIFYTNYQSRKGRELKENPKAALLFHWPEFGRQIRVEGMVQQLSREESAQYFSSRPRTSRIGAWASRQGEIIESRIDLEKAFRRFHKQFKGRDVPVPDYWGGYLLVPDVIEFWQLRPSRLHDRICYIRKKNASWEIARLSP
jgi:pyridoxamine 5'-phosphate oxidase